MKVILYEDSIPTLFVEPATPQNSRWSRVYEVEQEWVDQYNDAQKRCKMCRDRVIEQVNRQEHNEAMAIAFENQR